MPRDVSGVYSVPVGTDGISNRTISSSAYNLFVHDVETDLNTPRPIIAGGTGGSTAGDALTNLGAAPISLVATNAGLLSLVSSTQIKFAPYGGDQIKINGKFYTIPGAGISAGATNIWLNGSALQNLTPNNLYYVSIFNNAGTPTLCYFLASTNSHGQSTTAGNVGVEVITSAPSDLYSLVGMVQFTAGSQFVNSNIQRYVRTWFNRQVENTCFGNAYTAQRAVTAASPVEIHSEIRSNFVAWATEKVTLHFIGAISVDTVGATAYAALAVDAVYNLGNYGTYAYAAFQPSTPLWAPANQSTTIYGLTEGLHFSTLYGWASSGQIRLGGVGGGSVFCILNGYLH